MRVISLTFFMVRKLLPAKVFGNWRNTKIGFAMSVIQLTEELVYENGSFKRFDSETKFESKFCNVPSLKLKEVIHDETTMDELVDE